ncbi:MAG TPA: energy transducer TonB [Steroidobacteraceae bacterium]|nr:energy transducer TonB [Steroidobacteraceae bacterium]
MSVSNPAPIPDSPAHAGEVPQHGRRRTDVVLVGLADESLIEVGPALGDDYRSFSADSAADLPGIAATEWIGFYDATVGADARSRFAQLEQQYHRHPWIVLCADEDRSNWQSALSRGSACAVISRAEIGVESINTALEQAKRRLSVPAAAAPPPANPVLAQRRGPMIAGAVAIAVAAAATTWWWQHRHAAPPTAVAAAHARPASDNVAAKSTAAAGVAQKAPTASIEDLLSMARIAFRDPATQLPKADAPLQGTSALELYGAVLEQDPKNGEALDGVRRLQSVARLRVQNALQAGEADTAGRLLAVLQHSDIAPEELRALGAAVAAARPKQLAAQARSAMAAGNLQAAHQFIDQLAALAGEHAPVPELRKELDALNLDTELAADAQRVHAAIAADQLLDPAADNARTRFLAMRELARNNPQTVSAGHELLGALLRRARAAIGRQDFAGAQQVLTVAQDLGSPADLAETRTALDAAVAAKKAGDEAAAAAKLVRSSAPPTPAKAAVDAILSPKPARALQVDFPKLALEQNIQGYVTVEFTLNPDGSTSAASVVESSPHGTFDGSALAAIKHASFQTRDLADPHKPQRARFRIAYTLDDAGPAGATTVSKAAAISPAAPASAPAAELPVLSPRPSRPLQVDYPDTALVRRVQGYVVVEFMLNPDGSASSLSVVDSMPAHVFDRQALMAVKGAKFATTGLADPTRPQRARFKINFKPAE